MLVKLHYTIDFILLSGKLIGVRTINNNVLRPKNRAEDCGKQFSNICPGGI